MAAKAAIWSEGRLLCVREGERSDSPYDLPGGRLEAGEPIQHGLRREVREELGVEIASASELPIQTWSATTPEGVGVVALLYSVILASHAFVFSEGDEVTGARYLTLEELERLPGGIHKPHALAYFREGRARPR